VGGADGGRARVEGCGNGPVIVKQACGADDDVLSDRECEVKRIYFLSSSSLDVQALNI
jgi:hypothetical protein